jgi:hypothetical protein
MLEPHWHRKPADAATQATVNSRPRRTLPCRLAIGFGRNVRLDEQERSITTGEFYGFKSLPLHRTSLERRDSVSGSVFS